MTAPKPSLQMAPKSFELGSRTIPKMRKKSATEREEEYLEVTASVNSRACKNRGEKNLQDDANLPSASTDCCCPSSIDWGPSARPDPIPAILPDVVSGRKTAAA